ncbi:serine/threonine protein kinase, partial [bacterium]|nr:serine/threonine protein kinase [bacterium]
MSEFQPKNIDGYPVVKEIGAGASGIVYQVKLPGKQRYAALKLFTGKIDPAEELRFKREFGAIARCRHDGIVSVYGIGDHKGRPYILMEFIKGKPLDEALREGLKDMEPLPVSRQEILASAIIQVLETLRYLHDRKIVHRDIKPANLVWTENNKVKLLDFGMAWSQQGKSDDDLGGTAGYQAPELFLHKRVDPRIDIYSLGVCLYKIIAGCHPFGNFAGWQDLIEKQLGQKFNRLSVMNPGYGEIWEFFTAKMMNPNPLERFQSAVHAIVDLSRLASLNTSCVTDDRITESGWGILDTSWIGASDILKQAASFIKSNKNTIFDAPEGAGKSRFLNEIISELDNEFTIVSFDARIDPPDLWLKRFVDSVKPVKDLSDAIVIEALGVIDSFMDKKQNIEGETPEKIRNTFIR